MLVGARGRDDLGPRTCGRLAVRLESMRQHAVTNTWTRVMPPRFWKACRCGWRCGAPSREQRDVLFSANHEIANPWELPPDLVPAAPNRRVGHVVNLITGCWEWHGKKDRNGYGNIGAGFHKQQ